MNSTRSRLVDVTLCVAALLGGVYLLATTDAPTTSELLARENNVFSFFRSEDLVRIEIEQPAAAASRVVLRKVTDREDLHAFYLGESGEREADVASVAELVRSLEFATWQRRAESGAFPEEEARLATPLLEIRVSLRGASSRLVIGPTSPALGNGSSHFARIEGGGPPALGFVRADWVERLLLDQRSFRGRLLLPYAKSELASISLSTASPPSKPKRVELSADAAGFRLGPAGVRADRDATDHVLFQMARVSLEDFLDDAEATKLLDADADSFTVTQTPRSGPPVSVRLGARCPSASDRIVAQRTSPDLLSGCVSATVAPGLRQGWGDLGSRTLATFGADEIDHVTIVGPGGSVDLIRKDAAFELLGEGARAVPLELGNDFVAALARTHGTLTNDPLPTRDPSGSGTLVAHGISADESDPTQGGVVRQTFRFWFEDTRVLVERADDGAHLALPLESTWFLNGDTAWARSRELVRFDESSVESLRVTGSATSALVRDGGALLLVEPKGFNVDPRLSGQLLRALDPLQVVRFAPEERGSVKKVSTRLELVTRRDGKKEEFVLEIGPRTRGGHVAWSSNSDLPFVVAPEFVRLVATSLVDRSALVLDPTALTRLEIDAGKIHYEFERSGDTLVRSDGAPLPHLSGALEEALRTLEPLAAVHVGATTANEGFSTPTLRLRATQKDAKGRPETVIIEFGRSTVHQDRDAYFVRSSAADAVFVVERRSVDALLDLL